MHNMGRDKRASITFGSSGNTKVTSMGSQNAVNRSQINQTQIYSKRGKARGEAHYLSQTGAQKGNISKLGSSIEYNSRGFKEQSSFNFRHISIEHDLKYSNFKGSRKLRVKNSVNNNKDLVETDTARQYRHRGASSAFAI